MKCTDYLKIIEGRYFSNTVLFVTNKLTIFTALFLPRVVKSLVYTGKWKLNACHKVIPSQT